MLADNKLTDRSDWDDAKLAWHLKELSDLVLDFDIESTGFELPEVDFRIQSLDSPDVADTADEFDFASGPAVSKPSDLWLLGEHKIYCGDALDPASFEVVLGGEKGAAVFTDPPYNVKIDDHVCLWARIGQASTIRSRCGRDVGRGFYPVLDPGYAARKCPYRLRGGDLRQHGLAAHGGNACSRPLSRLRST
jgi:hypothetical protein